MTAHPEAPGPVRWIVRTLEAAGFETWAVGGAVRDALAGRASGDWDLATRARPPEIQKVFPRTVPIGVAHGTVGVLARTGVLYEVTTFRRDVETTGRHAVVSFADTLDDDLARRDFTINAVAWHPIRDELHDPFGGQADMEAGILRTVGDPAERFAEDYLRILRGLRFAGTFRLAIEGETWRALTAAVPKMRILSPERLREELDKILAEAAPPSSALALYVASGVAAYLYPEIDRMVGCPRGERGDWFSHGLRTVDLLSPGRPTLRWAALLQGVGEAAGSTGAGEEGRTPRDRATLRAAALLERLRSSNARIREVAELVRWVARPPAPDGSEAELRRWLSAAGRERLTPLFRIWLAGTRADEARGEGGESAWTRAHLLVLWRRLRGLVRSGDPLAIDELALTGRDLIAMGFTPGRHFGEVLEHLLDRVLEDPSLNRVDHLRKEASRWLEERSG